MCVCVVVWKGKGKSELIQECRAVAEWNGRGFVWAPDALTALASVRVFPVTSDSGVSSYFSTVEKAEKNFFCEIKKGIPTNVKSYGYIELKMLVF